MRVILLPQGHRVHSVGYSLDTPLVQVAADLGWFGCRLAWDIPARKLIAIKIGDSS